MRKSINIFVQKIYNIIHATYWYHDGTEHVLVSKPLENELFWTTVNDIVLMVSPVIQRFNIQ